MGRTSPVKIEVKFGNVDEAAEELKSLAAALEGRKLELSFSVAQGRMPEELIEVAGQLTGLGAALAQMAERTAQAVAYAGKTFKEGDEQAASQFSG